MNRSVYGLFASFYVCAAVVIAAPSPKEDPDPEPTETEIRKSQLNLKQLGLGFHFYHDAYNHFPTNITDKNGKPLLSWRVLLLPYFEQEGLFKEFKLDEAWDSENNKKLIEKIPSIYAPVRGKGQKGTTFYQSFSGPGTMFPGKRIRFADVTDGSSNTILVAEAKVPVIWTKPDDMPFMAREKLPEIGGLLKGKVNILFGDGSVRLLKKQPKDELFKALITINGGEVVSVDDLP